MQTNPPPRLLLGVAFLFWGGMAGQPLVGLLAALFVEGHKWLPALRWDFDEPAFLKAWYLTVVFVLFGAVSVWLDGPSPRRIYDVFTWLPVLLLPMQFVQSYGTRPTIPVYIFTLAARTRIEREKKLGRLVESRKVSFGWVTLTAIILGAALGRNAESTIFVPCVVAIVAWALREIRGEKSSVAPWLAAVLAVSMLGLAGQVGMQRFYDWLARGAGLYGRSHIMKSLRSTQIALGGLGDEKNSSRIFWRLLDIEGPCPELLRTATYNHYLAGYWKNYFPRDGYDQLVEQFPIFGFDTLPAPVAGPDDVLYQVFDSSEETDPAPAALPKFTLLGRVEQKSLLPTPPGIRSLRDPATDWIEKNPMGTVRLYPQSSVLETRVCWNDKRDIDAPPWIGGQIEPDLLIPRDEAETIHAVARQLGLDKAQSFQEKVLILQAFFLRHFRYSRYLDGKTSSIRPWGAIGRFLTKGRAGHCEYFATATTLLLRDAGVPARYSIGFAVNEVHPARHEALVRGTHAHAWCRAWNAETKRWVDVDLTPPGWESIDAGTGTDWTRRLLDRLQILYEDFIAWRARSETGNLFGIVLWVAGSLLGIYIVWHLARSRRRTDPAHNLSGPASPPLPPALRRLVHAARRRLGPRPPGLPLGTWLAQLEDTPLGPDPQLRELISLHARLRFDPTGPPTPDSESRLASLARALAEKLKKT